MGSGTKRNKPCHCGSGKKYKRCCEGRLPVSQTTTVDFGEPTVVNGYRIGDGGEMELLRDGKVLTPQKAWAGSHREKLKGGEKPLMRVPLSPETLQIGEAAALKRYDRIFVIDTNTKFIGDTLLSVSCFAECRFRKDTGKEVFEYKFLGAFDFQNGPVPKCENFAWHLLIQLTQASQDYDSSGHYVIITDSDLGQHSTYNARSEPYFAEYQMPDNFMLSYATDKGRSLSNKVIGLCDRTASVMWQQIENGSNSLHGGRSVEDGWCSQIRLWLNNTDLSKAGWFRFAHLPIEALAAPRTE